jgi:hypothetical protein
MARTLKRVWYAPPRPQHHARPVGLLTTRARGTLMRLSSIIPGLGAAHVAPAPVTPSKPPQPSARPVAEPSLLTQVATKLMKPTDASARPAEFMPLTAADAREMELASGLIRRGEGELEGVLQLRPPQGGTVNASRVGEEAVLVTHRLGSRAEIAYRLDLPPSKARELVGQRVKVQGRFTLPEGFERGAATGTKLLRAVSSGVVDIGQDIAVSGRVAPSMGAAISSGGYREPLGTYLELDHPISVRGQEFGRVYLEGGDALSLHQHIALKGRLEANVFGDNHEPTLSVRLGRTGGLHRTDSPEPMRLDPVLLASVSDLMGYRVEGTGVLQGELTLREIGGVQRPYLVTFQFGGEAGFALDLPLEQATPLLGKTVNVAGVIKNGFAPVDRIEGAKVVATVPDRPSFAPGTWATLRGVVTDSPGLDAQGQLRSRLVLVLADHILVDGKRTQLIELPSGSSLAAGAKVELFGPVDVARDAHGAPRAAALAKIHAVKAAPDLDFCMIDSESTLDDFSRHFGPRRNVVVPADQSAASS